MVTNPARPDILTPDERVEAWARAAEYLETARNWVREDPCKALLYRRKANREIAKVYRSKLIVQEWK